jgi:hypothetical protein
MEPQELNPTTQKLKYYSQETVKDPYAQISQNGFTPLGNLKTYSVKGLYDRPEPTKLRDLRELYTVPFATTPFLGNVVPSRKYVDIDSESLRSPVYLNKKSAIDTSQVTIYPEQVFVKNDSVSPELNNYYEQATTINLPGGNPESMNQIDENKIGLGVGDFNNLSRFVNRWDYVDPKVVQNVDNIIMNVVTEDGAQISLPRSGVSSRNELRNYVEVNKC